ncbi:MAG: hypothetical protein EXR49_03685 [Dehalococcoidia bacterium]|nr:hypothetical protein [Dehalococcoidia bacterium]
MEHPVRRTLAALSLIAAIVIAACGSTSPTPAPAVPSLDAFDVRVGSSDIALGPNRLLLGIFTRDGTPLGKATVLIRFFALDSATPSTARGESSALYLGDAPDAPQALYAARVNLDHTGGWEAEATLSKPGAAPVVKRAGFRVKANPDVPFPGQPAPASVNQTIDATPIEQLTSQRPPGDPDLYRLTIANALAQQKPLLVVFSTPAFCQSRTCGPQMEAVQRIKAHYAAQMNFIHIEIFDRPDLLIQGQGTQRLRQTVVEWRLPTDPWAFLVTAQGAVYERFEGFAPEYELQQSIQAMLAGR